MEGWNVLYATVDSSIIIKMLWFSQINSRIFIIILSFHGYYVAIVKSRNAILMFKWTLNGGIVNSMKQVFEMEGNR